MEPTPDELAGIVDLFGGLTREELRRAVRDLSARRGTAFDADALEGAIEEARRSYYLLEVDHGGEAVLAPGPAALPTLPEHGVDLPHMLDVEERSIDRGALARAAEERLRADAARAVDDGDDARIEALLDVCYELDAWGPVDTADVRERLDRGA